jgi:hypothetical protein
MGWYWLNKATLEFATSIGSGNVCGEDFIRKKPRHAAALALVGWLSLHYQPKERRA